MRRIFVFASAASLMLFVMVFVPFLWSLVSEDEWDLGHRSGAAYSGRTIELACGYFMLTWYQGGVLPKDSVGEGVEFDLPTSHYPYAPHHDALDYDDLAGFGIGHRKWRDGSLSHSQRTLFVPHWPIVTILAILPGVWLAPFMPRVVRRLAVRRSSGPPQGICVTCGYNLTGNTSGVCPECGTAT